MVFRSKWKYLPLVVPLVLFGVLWLIIARRPRVLPGLGGSATTIAFAPDGKTLVCASSNNYVQMWRPQIKRWHSFEGANSYANNLPPLFVRLRFSPDSKTLYAGGSRTDQHYSSFAHAWDVATRQRKFSFNQLQSPAFDVSPDGRWAALGSQNYVTLVDLHGKPVDWSGKPLPPRKDGVRDLAPRLLPSRQLATAGNVTCVAFSPDSKTLVVGDEGFQWQLAFWNVRTGKQIPQTTSIPAFGVPSFLEWSPDGKRIAAVDNAKIVIYDVAASQAIEASWPTSKSPVPAAMLATPKDIAPLAWSPDGQWLFSGGDEVRQWRAKDLKMQYSYGVAGPVAVSPDGKTIATANRPKAGEPHGVLLWNIE